VTPPLAVLCVAAQAGARFVFGAPVEVRLALPRAFGARHVVTSLEAKLDVVQFASV
jgi:hypothetical protein